MNLEIRHFFPGKEMTMDRPRERTLPGSDNIQYVNLAVTFLPRERNDWAAGFISFLPGVGRRSKEKNGAAGPLNYLLPSEAHFGELFCSEIQGGGITLWVWLPHLFCPLNVSETQLDPGTIYSV